MLNGETPTSAPSGVGSPNSKLRHEHGNEEDMAFEESSSKPDAKNGELKKTRREDVNSTAQEVREEQATNATEVREEHATELHAQTIIGNDHIQQKPAQAPRLTNNESNPSVVTQHQSGELQDSDVTVDVSVQSPTLTPKQLHDKIEDEIVGTLRS